LTPNIKAKLKWCQGKNYANVVLRLTCLPVRLLLVSSNFKKCIALKCKAGIKQCCCCCWCYRCCCCCCICLSCLPPTLPIPTFQKNTQSLSASPSTQTEASDETKRPWKRFLWIGSGVREGDTLCACVLVCEFVKDR
jgi:hypothetical protein